MNLLAIDVGFGFGPTPIIMLISVFVLVFVFGGLLLLGSQALGGLVDKRWPADEALSPSELLWGEVGGHVQKTFPGLDPEIAKDLSPFVKERKVSAGETIVEAGLPAVSYFLVVKGSVTVQANPSVTLGPGDHFGGDDIVRRHANSHTVVAAEDSTLVSLPADDYVAGLALGAEVDDDEYVDHALQEIVAAGRLPAPTAAQPMDVSPPAAAAPASAPAPAEPAPAAAAQTAPQAPAEPAPAAAGWAEATHVVGGDDLPGYPLPEGETASTTLRSGTPLLWVEGLPGWAHVRTEAGWQGWVRTGGIQPR